MYGNLTAEYLSKSNLKVFITRIISVGIIYYKKLMEKKYKYFLFEHFIIFFFFKSRPTVCWLQTI